MSEERIETNPPEAQTSEFAHDKGGSPWIIWLTLALLAAYPLSLGPVAGYYGYKAPKAVIKFYAPIRALRDRSKVAGDVIDWYVHLWRVH
jgi:hypothetical protein